MEHSKSVKGQCQMYIGWYVDKIQNELLTEHKSHLLLVQYFLEILDGIYAILYQYIHSPLHENKNQCSCNAFINQHLDWLTILENKVSDIVNRHVSVNNDNCWIVQMHHKYKLLYHLCIRKL